MTNSGDGNVRLRNLSDDLKARIKRGEENEARLVAKADRLKGVEEELRAQRGELGTLRRMLEMAMPKEPLAKKVPANGVDPDAEFE